MNNSQHTRLLTLVGLIVLLALALVSGGCAASAQATPTPTKTPRPEATQPPPATATPVPPTPAPPTATEVSPTAVPATDTPAPVEGTAAADSSAQPAPAATPSADQPISAKIVATLPPRQPGVSILTGLRPADPAVLERRPLAVKVDNDPAVIPQSGMGKADIVVESRKEGCLTRFTAIYQSQDAPKIGSVRSARLVDIELPVIFDAILAYSGASGPVQQKLSQSDLGQAIPDAKQRRRALPRSEYRRPVQPVCQHGDRMESGGAEGLEHDAGSVGRLGLLGSRARDRRAGQSRRLHLHQDVSASEDRLGL